MSLSDASSGRGDDASIRRLTHRIYNSFLSRAERLNRGIAAQTVSPAMPLPRVPSLGALADAIHVPTRFFLSLLIFPLYGTPHFVRFAARTCMTKLRGGLIATEMTTCNRHDRLFKRLCNMVCIPDTATDGVSAAVPASLAEEISPCMFMQHVAPSFLHGA